MKLKTSDEIFRSCLIPVAAFFCALAALLGIPGIVLLFDKSYALLLAEDLVLSGFTDPSAIRTWGIVNNGITVVNFLCPCAFSVCLWVTVHKTQRIRGILALSTVAQWMLYAVNIGGICAAIIFPIRFVMHILSILPHPNVLYLLFALCLFEPPMAAQAVFLFIQLRKFLNSIMDSAAGIAHGLASEKPEHCSIPSFAATGFTILGILCLLLCLDRVFTLTIISDAIQSYYSILVAEHLGMWLSGGSLLASAVGNLLISIYLRRCKRDTERNAFFAERLKK